MSNTLEIGRRVNDYGALDRCEPTNDPLLEPPPLFDHRDEEEVQNIIKPRKSVRFAEELEEPEESVTNQRGIHHRVRGMDSSGDRSPVLDDSPGSPAHRYRTRGQCPNINVLVNLDNFQHVDVLEDC
eukprot:6471955-Amphidinium_carterae.2